MSQDADHCTTNSTLLPALLKTQGYKTHSIGKWDIGFARRECTATFRGFDTFYGYYCACEANYWTHDAAGGYPGNCAQPVFDLSNNTLNHIDTTYFPSNSNGTYNRELFSNEAVRLIRGHDASVPMYLYLAFMNVHDGCETPHDIAPPVPHNGAGKQAPLETVDMHYATTLNDTYKVSGAMYTQLDMGVAEVVAALKAQAMWQDTLFIFTSDNGGPLDHTTNYPLRGGKHTFFEG
eukprot:UC1_evm1s699